MRWSVALLQHIFLLLILLLCSQSGGAETAPYRTLANPCAGCHGTNGYSMKPMPMLAGLPRAYLNNTMQKYKTGKRASTIMGRIAKGYSDDEIQAITVFFASQYWLSPVQEVDPILVERGRQIHADKCETCHRDNGRYQDDKMPRLAGQWREYLEIVLQEYWQPDRHMGDLFMKLVLKPLRPEELTAMAHFYASQK